MLLCTLDGKKGYPSTKNNIKVTLENPFVKDSGCLLYTSKPDEETPSAKIPTDIEMAKAAKIAEIAAYSDSEAVNSLTFNGIKTWLTRTVRDGYDTSVTAAKNLGETNVTFMVGENEMQLPVEQARRVLDLSLIHI